LNPVYTLAILNENYNSANSFYHHFQILNKENNIEIIKGLEFVVVELLKFTSDRWSDRKISALWLRFLKEVGENTTELPPEMTENEHIRHAAELCEKGAFTPAELYAYEKYWDIVRTEKTLIEGSREEGIEIGLEKGEAIGLEKGRIEGVINGRRAGAPIDTIAAITGLTTEQITGILKQHGLI
jgi:predicted transposase/invertase (TIGR01784 family)